MRVLSWNLYHGRDFPPDPALFTLRSRLLRRTERGATHGQVNRPLLDEFATVLDGLDWDVALLQEAPPRWFAELPRLTRSSGARLLTSRNWLPPLQGRLADLNPDLMASWEGGSNQILVRHPGRIVDHRRLTLAIRPERRRMQWARLDGGLCVANLHASAGDPRRAAPEVMRAAGAAVDWSGDDPLVFGGDLNLRPADSPEPFAKLRERFGLAEPTGPRAIDHLLARGLGVVERPRALAPEERELTDPRGGRLRLSDHAPVVATFVR
jgi:endonuclease/exonuclease/phosphatase family metal-dependent hydrolase